MPTATANLLQLLDLLQSRPSLTGPEAAARLGVDRRTVRRYVAALQDLGIPVEGERGVGGGYRLRPGYRLPPLMLDADEAAVVALGLAAARRLGLGDAASADAALAKIRRVLPDALRRRVEALDDVLGFTMAGAAPAGVPGRGCWRWPTPRRAAGACASPTRRSRASAPSARRVRAASSRTPAAGTSRPSTTAATRRGPSAWTGWMA